MAIAVPFVSFEIHFLMKVQKSVQVNCSPGAVFSFIPDPRYYALWHSGFLTVEVTPHSSLQVGSLIRLRSRMFMKEFETVTEVLELFMDRSMVYRGVSGPFTYKGSYLLYPTGGGTLITWTLEGDTQGFFGMAEPVLSKMAEMKLEADLEKIKEVLESDGVPSLE